MKRGKIRWVLCPYCKGVGRSIHHVGGAAFKTVMDPQYSDWCNNYPDAKDTVWHKEIWVCAACLGEGTRARALSRILSGDFIP